jgi:hypothetical protein
MKLYCHLNIVKCELDDVYLFKFEYIIGKLNEHNLHNCFKIYILCTKIIFILYSSSFLSNNMDFFFEF